MALLDEDERTPTVGGRSHRMPLLVAALVVLGLGCGAFLWLRPSPAPPGPASPSLSSAPAPAASRPSTTAGALEVTADKPGAVVSVDGRTLGDAPQTVAALSPGRHAVRVEAPGFEPWTQEAHVLPGLTTRLQARLMRAPASLRIECDVPGASIFLDRRFVGPAPVELHDIAPGPHQVNVSAEGFDPRAETVDVAPGRAIITVRLREVRLAEALEVVHRHALGSCAGRLTASPAGVRYETQHAKDGFDVPLAALERLEVDYLKKTLSLKLRGGRTYTFAPRGGSADPLLVFQQNVEKARARAAGLAAQ